MFQDLQDSLENGDPIYGTMVRFNRDPGIANMVANAGYDFMLIDMEHSVYSFETVADIIRVARGVNLAPIVRPPGRVPPILSRLMDAGAAGVMVPMTETGEQAREIRDACKYTPIGKRGVAGALGQNDYQRLDAPSMMRLSNEQSLIIAQVESQTGVENIDDIVSTDGIDGVIIGPHDLSNSLGIVGQITDSKVTDCIARVVEACKKHKKYSGIHTGNMVQLYEWRKKGMQLLAYRTDADALMNAFTEYNQQMKQES